MSSPLISTEALARQLADPAACATLRLFDATVQLRRSSAGPFSAESARADYEAAHIAGAAFADLTGEFSDREAAWPFTRPGVARLEALLSAAGVSAGHRCVVYSSGSPMWATRLAWMLRSLGAPAQVLDGGLAKWRAEGRPLVAGNECHAPTRFVARPDARRWAERDEVRAAIGNGAVCTINALTAALHDGSGGAPYGRAGHIAGSVNLPFPALLASDGTFRGTDELRAAFEAIGALAAPRTICYCGAGIAATMTALALVMAGHPDVAVYDGSLSEWAADPSLPMSCPSPPSA